MGEAKGKEKGKKEEKVGWGLRAAFLFLNSVLSEDSKMAARRRKQKACLLK
jgi:hypothetical protein